MSTVDMAHNDTLPHKATGHNNKNIKYYKIGRVTKRGHIVKK